ncbi:MAG: dihydroorotate dehydrogenase (quinone) [Betaproteobacteria bacterium]
MGFYTRIARPLLFGFDPERIHVATLRACALLGPAPFRAAYEFDHPSLHIRVGGIDFPNPVGLPAGFDKNATAARALAGLGFGSIDVGSVSERPSAGNAIRPRLFRIPEDEGIIVYYGVPNDGAEVIAARVKELKLPVPLGVSLVETNSGTPAPVDEVIAELSAAARRFTGMASYLALNLNCPNSAGGISHFDSPVHLRALLAVLSDVEALPPVFIRITPPRDHAGIDAVLAAIDPFAFVRGLSFFDAKLNFRSRLRTPPAELARMPGSVSVPATLSNTQATIREWYRRIDRKRLALVAVGGICSAEDAYRTIRLGASLVQVYSALVYQGPGVVRRIKQGLAALLERDGFRHVSEAIGIDNTAR